jgi:hypothetical protein
MRSDEVNGYGSMTSAVNQTEGSNDQDPGIEFSNKHFADPTDESEFREAQRKICSGGGTDSGFPIHS